MSCQPAATRMVPPGSRTKRPMSSVAAKLSHARCRRSRSTRSARACSAVRMRRSLTSSPLPRRCRRARASVSSVPAARGASIPLAWAVPQARVTLIGVTARGVEPAAKVRPRRATESPSISSSWMTALPHKESTRKPSPAPASGPAPPEAMMEALTADRIGGTMAGESKDGRVILALDQGTTSARAIVFAAVGGVLSLAQREIGLDFPQPGWVEQDPLEIWTAQRETAAEALHSSGVAVTDVAGIGVTNQRETTIVWDRATSLPIAPAIVWQDRRTAERCEELRRAGHEALVRRKTGLVLDPYFSATKIRWLLDSVPGARDWDDELLELFGVPRAFLPRVCDTSGVVGQTDAAGIAHPGQQRPRHAE